MGRAIGVGSVTASNGVVSIMTKSNSSRIYSNRTSTCCEELSSAGLFGRAPHGMSVNPSTSTLSVKEARNSDCPLRTVANPREDSIPKVTCCRGRLMSASTSRTRFPDWAMETARLAASVDLPSPGVGLVT